MGLDTQVIRDSGYYVAESEGGIIGCGGWSRRQTLYGGDDSAVAREPRLLDPSSEAARIRAMYTHPGWTRRGIGGAVLKTCEEAAAGFRHTELMATLSGEPLYVHFGQGRVKEVVERVGRVKVPFIQMRKAFIGPVRTQDGLSTLMLFAMKYPKQPAVVRHA